MAAVRSVSTWRWSLKWASSWTVSMRDDPGSHSEQNMADRKIFPSSILGLDFVEANSGLEWSTAATLLEWKRPQFQPRYSHQCAIGVCTTKGLWKAMSLVSTYWTQFARLLHGVDSPRSSLIPAAGPMMPSLQRNYYPNRHESRRLQLLDWWRPGTCQVPDT